MNTYNIDDDLRRKSEAEGPAALPGANVQGYVEHDGAQIWYSTYGSGPPVIMLHGALGHSGNWGYPTRVAGVFFCAFSTSTAWSSTTWATPSTFLS